MIAAMTTQSNPSPATTEDLLGMLDGLGIVTETHSHAAVFTVEESKALRGELPGGHCKNLFLKDKKGALWLVVCSEDRPIDMKGLRHLIGSSHLSFGKPDLLMDVLGVTPGSVTPFALINDSDLRVNVVLDADMMAASVLNYHPLTNGMTTAIRPIDLLAFIAACGHAPAQVKL